jgi:hypothetical protein
LRQLGPLEESSRQRRRLTFACPIRACFGFEMLIDVAGASVGLGKNESEWNGMRMNENFME